MTQVYECAELQTTSTGEVVCNNWVVDVTTVPLLPDLSIAEANELGLTVIYILALACAIRIVNNLI